MSTAEVAENTSDKVISAADSNGETTKENQQVADANPDVIKEVVNGTTSSSSDVTDETVDDKNSLDNAQTKKSNGDDGDGAPAKQNNDESSNGTAVVDDKEDLKKSAYSLLAEGNKKIVLADYSEAMKILGEACQKFVELYGEFGPECGDAYYSYGCACLHVAQDEATLLDVTEAEKEDAANGKQAEDKAAVAVAEKKEEPDEEEEEDGDDEKDDNEEDAEDEDVEQEETIKDEDDVEEEEEEEEEEVETLQLAWELLECAKKIFIELDNKTKLADCYVQLGEVNVMTGNYSTAIDDLKTALELRKSITTANDDRFTAMIHFNLALAFNLNNQFTDAASELQASRDILQLKLDNLRKQDDASPKEIKEIDELIKNIDEKSAEIQLSKEESFRTLKEHLKEDDEQGCSSSSSKSTGPPKNISHLIKRKVDLKRKVDDEGLDAEGHKKKLCSPMSKEVNVADHPE